jgi:hypothetical protein
MTPESEGRSTKGISQGEQLILLAEKIGQMSAVLIEVKNAVQARDDMLQKFYTEYKVEHLRVTDMASGANKRLDRVENEIGEVTSNMSKIQEAMRPLISANKFLVWLGAAVGIMVVGLLWAILTNQVMVVMP